MSLITATLGRFAAPERRTMAVACGHVLHDGFTDLLYVPLPLSQAEFGLGYAEIGLLRALYVGAMAGFQIPAGGLAERLGGPLVLGLGTALAGIGYLVAGASAGFAMLAVALILGGMGSTRSTRSARIWSWRPSPASARAPRWPDTISPATSTRWRRRR
jgi:FSR family fosmidomycin resistance protein-like MFS transporter